MSMRNNGKDLKINNQNNDDFNYGKIHTNFKTLSGEIDDMNAKIKNNQIIDKNLYNKKIKNLKKLEKKLITIKRNIRDIGSLRKFNIKSKNKLTRKNHFDKKKIIKKSKIYIKNEEGNYNTRKKNKNSLMKKDICVF